MVAPSNNTVAEKEVHPIVAEDITGHVVRMRNTEDRGKTYGLTPMRPYAEHDANVRATAVIDVIAVACTAGRLVNGHGWGQDLRACPERAASGISCVTFLRSIVTTLTHVGLHRVVVVAPFIDALHRTEIQLFTVNRAEAPAVSGLGIRHRTNINEFSPTGALHLAHRPTPTASRWRLHQPREPQDC